MADKVRPDQPPPPSVDELAAIRALFKGTANQRQQAYFTTYLLKMCGIAQSEYGVGEFWPFMGGRRWVATELMKLADVHLVPDTTRSLTENRDD